ncbi:MAG: FKBP-type peptidyl-prolyl cis-trans isomerase [Planctomycetota bacterium]|jgi:FKBP-type peptidyl-prolyl cis-trans isomerase
MELSPMRNFTTISLALLFAGLASCSTQNDLSTDSSQPMVEQTVETSVPTSTWAAGDTIPAEMSGVADIQILEVHNNGTGEVCGLGKTATLQYVAMLADGTVIDPGTRPFSFAVGQGKAIKGWDVVVSKMRVGDSFTITLPQQLAYGPSKGDLKFDMELLSAR